MKKKRKVHPGRVLLLAAGLAAAGSLLVWGAGNLLLDRSQKEEDRETEMAALVQNEESAAQKGTSSFTFTGVGDNLLHDPIFVYYEEDTGGRDFLSIYENTLSYTQSSDLSYINFETVCAGDAYGLSGYPSFNGPLEFIDALDQAGFNWFSTSSNHTLDAGVAGLLTEMEYIEEQTPEIVYTGTYLSQERSLKPVVKEINGIKVGLVGFTYGLNGYQVPEGYEWIVNVYTNEDGSVNYDMMEQYLEALNEVSDVQIVAMHWGQEYHTDISDQQREVAAFLNQQGVEVVIGTHPHVIQPVEWIENDGQTTLVYYSLGNFLSAQDGNENMIGGMASFTLNYDFDSQKASFENVKFIPTITYISPDLRTYRTYAISGYTDDIAQSQYVYAVLGQDMSLQFVQEYVAGIIGDPEGIEVVYE